MRTTTTLVLVWLAVLVTAKKGIFRPLGNGDFDFQNGNFTVDLVGKSGKMKLSRTGTDEFIMLSFDRLEEVDGTTGAPISKGAVPSWPSQHFTWRDTDCVPPPNAVDDPPTLHVCFNATVNVGSNGKKAPTADVYVDVRLYDRDREDPPGCSRNDDAPCLPGGECDLRKLKCDDVEDETCNEGECYDGWAWDEFAERCFKCTGTDQNNNAVDVPTDLFLDEGCPAQLCRSGRRESFTWTALVDDECPSGTGYPNDITQVNADYAGCDYVDEQRLKFSVKVADWPFQAADNRLRLGAVLKSSSKAGQDEEGNPVFDDTFAFENTDDVLICDTADDAECDTKKLHSYSVESDPLHVSWVFPHFNKRMDFDPTLIGKSTNKAGGGGKDANFKADGYAISLIGKSGKLRLAHADDLKRYASLTFSRMEEFDSDGNVVTAVPSWASQHFTWKTGADCKWPEPANAGLRACFERTVNIGSNGANAKEAGVYVEVRLLNTSYYEPAGCQRPCSDEGRCTKLKLKCDDEADEQSCLDECIDGWKRNSEGACFQCYPEGNRDQPIPTVFYPDDSCPADTVVLCRMGASGSYTYRPADEEGCSDDETPVSSFLKDTATTFECNHYPEHGLKFGLEVTDWPFESTDNKLAFGATLKASGSIKELLERRVLLSDNFYIESESTASICDANDDCTTEDLVVNEYDQGELTWVFPNFAHRLVYDPVIGEEAAPSSPTPGSGDGPDDSSQSSPAASAPVTTSATLGFVLVVVLFFF